MSSNSLTTYSDGDTISAASVNQYKTALNQNVVPRNSSGVATNDGGDIGESSLKFKKAHISIGYIPIGTVIDFYSYNDTVTPGRGWLLCNAQIINEANYESAHGSGTWTTDAASSPLSGLYTPDFDGRYAVGTDAVTQDGSIAITAEGNTDNEVSLIAHNHGHTHEWMHSSAHLGTNDSMYDSAGNSRSIGNLTSAGGVKLALTGNGLCMAKADGLGFHTNKDSTNTTAATQDIQPDSVAIEKWIKVA